VMGEIALLREALHIAAEMVKGYLCDAEIL
jgi:hypothetical protein